MVFMAYPPVVKAAAYMTHSVACWLPWPSVTLMVLTVLPAIALQVDLS